MRSGRGGVEGKWLSRGKAAPGRGEGGEGQGGGGRWKEAQRKEARGW